jgi:hypothetical protein
MNIKDSIHFPICKSKLNVNLFLAVIKYNTEYRDIQLFFPPVYWGQNLEWPNKD